LPEKKDYGVSAFQVVASEITRRVAPKVARHLLIGARGHLDIRTAPLEPVNVATLEQAGALFAAADIVISNDTGLMHLAALCNALSGPPQVIGLYGRHSYRKWSTGRRNHHAIATAFSEWMHKSDLCPVRDNIDDLLFSASANLRSIPPAFVAQMAVELISG
jgi:ADP-heptose:LPS heptosyltransferase